MITSLLMRRADALADCLEGSDEEIELKAIVDAIEAWWQGLVRPPAAIAGGSVEADGLPVVRSAGEDQHRAPG